MKEHITRVILQDRKTGTAIGSYAYVQFVENDQVMNESAEPEDFPTGFPSRQELCTHFQGILSALNINPNDVEIVRASKEQLSKSSEALEETSKGRQNHALDISVDKHELEGDGQDSAVIQIKVVDGHGETMQTFDGELLVETSRGRLSAKGGRIKAHRGVAHLKLTSVPETVNRVVVTVSDPAGNCKGGSVMLAFL